MCLPINAFVNFPNFVCGGLDPTHVVHTKDIFWLSQAIVSGVVCGGLDPTHIMHTKDTF